jgi:hypothetical protein
VTHQTGGTDECQREQDVEIERQIRQIEPPGLCAVDIRTLTRSAEHVVEHNVQWNNGQLFIRVIIDRGDSGLCIHA